MGISLHPYQSVLLKRRQNLDSDWLNIEPITCRCVVADGAECCGGTAQFTWSSAGLETKLGVNQISAAVVNKGLLLVSAATISFNAAH